MCLDRFIPILIEKAEQTETPYRISAIAFNKKGEVLGTSCCNFSLLGKVSRKGTGVHAERKLMKRYGSNIKTIVICRIGKSGDILPIVPCVVCQKIADKLGIKIVSVKS